MTETLSVDLIKTGLETGIVGSRIIYLPSTGSTNEVARKEAAAGASEGTVIITGHQTRGRGRLTRSWMTPEGNIALSVILYPELSLIHSLIMIASLSVVHAIETVTGLTAGIKWPNDVLIDGRKVCGILIESDIRKERVHYTVTGIGININIGPDDLAGVPTPATSLRIETGADVSRLALIRVLLTEMDRRYRFLKTGGSVFGEWKERLVTLGTEVKVTGVDTVIEGIAESVGVDGSLLVRDTDGFLHTVVAGDVTLRR